MEIDTLTTQVNTQYSKERLALKLSVNSEMAMWDPYSDTKDNRRCWRRAHLIRLAFALVLIAALFAKYFSQV